ncbi:MAG: DUF6427 family protein [Tannerellaceae bacterium]|jgi:hypothetical protein|nr:DUF6427 family protein [Tannerellaceae bacterium]
MRSKETGYDRQTSGIDTPFNYILLAGVSLLFWVSGYMTSAGYPLHIDASSTPLWKLISRNLTDKTEVYAAGLLLAAGGGFLIHRINYVLVIIREKTLVPFLLYILLVSSGTDFAPLSSASLGIFFLILAFYQLFISYHDNEAIRPSFNVGLFISAGSLLWIHILWFLPIFWWGMYRFKILSPRTFLASFAGTALVYWFLLGWCVWRQDYTPFTVPFASSPEAGFLFGLESLRPAEWIYVLYIFLLTALPVAHILLHESDDNLRTRRFLSFLIVFLSASFVFFFVYGQSSDEFLDVACMPAAILVARFFTEKKQKRRIWLYYILIFLLILISLLRYSWTSSLNMAI